MVFKEGNGDGLKMVILGIEYRVGSMEKELRDGSQEAE